MSQKVLKIASPRKLFCVGGPHEDEIAKFLSATAGMQRTYLVTECSFLVLDEPSTPDAITLIAVAAELGKRVAVINCFHSEFVIYQNNVLRFDSIAEFKIFMAEECGKIAVVAARITGFIKDKVNPA